MSYKAYKELTKSGIVFFVLVTGAAGYFLGLGHVAPFEFGHLIFTLISLYGFGAGTCALNQIQEIEIDRKMDRTKNRPLPSGKISKAQAYGIVAGLLTMGTGIGLVVTPRIVVVGWLTFLLYNLFYTLIWKRRWIFGAVPGAIPGAMPVVFGFAANNFFDPTLIFGFLIMFLWQMPHYWSLAIKYKDDYAKAGLPIMPTKLGMDRAFFHIGLYTFAYVAVAIATPFFVPSSLGYLLLVLPLSFKVIWEFFRFYNQGEQKGWLRFFLWTTFSILIFLIVPVVDRWQHIIFEF